MGAGGTEISADEAEGGRGARQSADHKIFAPSSIIPQLKKTKLNTDKGRSTPAPRHRGENHHLQPSSTSPGRGEGELGPGDFPQSATTRPAVARVLSPHIDADLNSHSQTETSLL